MKTKILLVIFGIAIIFAISLIPDKPGTAYPAPTPIPTQSGPHPPTGTHRANTEGLRISFANCAEGYIEWRNMPDYYWEIWTLTSPRIVIKTASGETHSYWAPFWVYLDTYDGNVRYWRTFFPASAVNGKVWSVEGIFYVNQDTPGNEIFWTANTYQMKCNVAWRHVLFFPHVTWP